MVKIFELKQEEEKRNAAALFFIDIPEYSRMFVMRDSDGNDSNNSNIGFGVLELDGAEVLIKYVCVPDDSKPFVYFDLMARSLLNIVRDMFGLRVIIKTAEVNSHCKKDGCPAKNIDYKSSRNCDSVSGKSNQSSVLYWQQFGFEKYAEGVLSVISHKIDLRGDCKRGENHA